MSVLPGQSPIGMGVGGGSAVADANTVLLIQCDGSNGSTTFTDVSPEAHSITNTGSVTVSTSNPKFGTGCADFTPSNYLEVPSSSVFGFGTGDFTIDFWANFDEISNNFRGLVAIGSGSGSGAVGIERERLGLGGDIAFRLGNTTRRDTGFNPIVGTWHHFALVRDGSTVDFYADGVSQLTLTGSAATQSISAAAVSIGRRPSASYDYDGQLDEIRISNTARWTADFTPPAAPYI